MVVCILAHICTSVCCIYMYCMRVVWATFAMWKLYLFSHMHITWNVVYKVYLHLSWSCGWSQWPQMWHIYFLYMAVKCMTYPFRGLTSLQTNMWTFINDLEGFWLSSVHLRSIWMCLWTSSDCLDGCLDIVWVSRQVSECQDMYLDQCVDIWRAVEMCWVVKKISQWVDWHPDMSSEYMDIQRSVWTSWDIQKGVQMSVVTSRNMSEHLTSV